MKETGTAHWNNSIRALLIAVVLQVFGRVSRQQWGVRLHWRLVTGGVLRRTILNAWYRTWFTVAAVAETPTIRFWFVSALPQGLIPLSL
jgi:hypothetical protein